MLSLLPCNAGPVLGLTQACSMRKRKGINILVEKERKKQEVGSVFVHVPPSMYSGAVDVSLQCSTEWSVGLTGEVR